MKRDSSPVSGKEVQVLACTGIVSTQNTKIGIFGIIDKYDFEM